MQDEHTLLLGEIKGKLDLVITGQGQTNKRLDSMDERLRTVEKKAAVNGAITGGLVAIGFELIKAKVGGFFGGNGG